MILRRLILSVILVLFASVSVGVIVGLDDAARSDLADQLPFSARPAGSPSARATPTPRAEHSTAGPQSSRTAAASTPAPSSPAPKRKHEHQAPRPTVYLTFDDGPSPYTPQVLNILRSTGSTATFFQLGVNIPGQEHIGTAIRAQGSNIGNHSYSHRDLTTLSAGQLRRQIARGPQSTCFRPPYGATNATVRKAIRQAGARQVLWTVDSRDWTQPGVGKLRRIGISKHVTNGGIIVMHDGGGNRNQTVKALPTLIRNVQARGFQVRALPHCG